MTTFFEFIPSAVSPFSFQPTLDGTVYQVTVTWNLFGQRYYANCYTLDGTLVFSLPLIGSPSGINLQDLVWQPGGAVTATVVTPHGLPIGAVGHFTIVDTTPDSYNGTFQVAALTATSFNYPLASDPGSPTKLGSAQYNINIAGGYFTSTLVWRPSSNRFEVSP